MNTALPDSLWHSVQGGTERLRVVFWLYFGVTGLGGLFLASWLGGLIMAFGPLGILFASLIFVVIVLYLGWCLYAIWQCAFAVDWRPWGYMARAFVVVGCVQLLYLAWALGALVYVVAGHSA